MLIEVNFEKSYTDNLEGLMPKQKYMLNIKLNGMIRTS